MIYQLESKEDYLERILMIQKEKGSCRAIDIAGALDYSKPSVSIALKKLKEEEMVEVDEKGGNITLTEKGSEIASRILERHLVLTQVLIQLGVDEETARKDACRIEHDLSPETFQKIKEKLTSN